MLAEALHHFKAPYDALAVTLAETDMDVPSATVLHAGHPVPTERSLAASEAVVSHLPSETAHD